MRNSLRLTSLLVATACGHGVRPFAARPGPPARLVVDSGAPVRVRLAGGGAVTGRLTAPFRPDSRELLLCEGGLLPACGTASAPGVRRLSPADLGAVAVRGRQGTKFALLGMYAGAVAGGLAYRDGSGAGFGLGGLLGLSVGHAVGSRVTGWTPLFPCGAHGECRWRGAWPAPQSGR